MIPRWWGTFPVPEGSWRRWRVGPLGLDVAHRAAEWDLGWTSDADPLRADIHVGETVPGDPPVNEQRARFGFVGGGPDIHLVPLLADRAVVVKPDTPFFVPQGQRLVVYVSTPVFLRIEAGSARARLVEVPVHRPSDTWFGPSTREGEICYGSRTRMRLRLEALERVRHRAVTPVALHNRSLEPLKIARMRLPVPNLSLFATGDGALWTEHLELDATGDVADVHIGDGPPGGAAGAERLSPARLPGRENLVQRVFSAVFS